VEIRIEMLTDEKAPSATFGKMRRLRRNRRLSGVTYWAVWAVVGLICLLLLASAVVGLAAG
jgi:hypothetical protein